jgi:hypothetical protein
MEYVYRVCKYDLQVERAEVIKRTAKRIMARRDVTGGSIERLDSSKWESSPVAAVDKFLASCNREVAMMKSRLEHLEEKCVKVEVLLESLKATT